MVSTESKGNVMRGEIEKVVQQIKDGNRPTRNDISDSLGYESHLILSSAYAWIYRERVDDLIEQARTGELEGATPVATLDGGEEQ